jgi:hypothetical protein
VTASVKSPAYRGGNSSGREVSRSESSGGTAKGLQWLLRGVSETRLPSLSSGRTRPSPNITSLRKRDGSCFAPWPTLVANKTAPEMGQPIVVVSDIPVYPALLVTLFPHFHPRPHQICTTPAPCPSPRSRLGSNDALLLTRNPTNFAPFRENPQPKPPFFAPPGHLPPINTGIRTANTTCCALYLTHPTEGGYFHDCTTPET